MTDNLRFFMAAGYRRDGEGVVSDVTSLVAWNESLVILVCQWGGDSFHEVAVSHRTDRVIAGRVRIEGERCESR